MKGTEQNQQMRRAPRQGTQCVIHNTAAGLSSIRQLSEPYTDLCWHLAFP